MDEFYELFQHPTKKFKSCPEVDDDYYFGYSEPFMKDSFDWDVNNFMQPDDYYYYNTLVHENSQSSHLDSISETTDDDISANNNAFEYEKGVSKIYLTQSDLPPGVHNAVKRFKVEYLYEKYEAMWKTYNEDYNKYLKLLKNAFDKMHPSEYSEEEKRSKEMVIHNVFERAKYRLNESFLKDKENILKEVIDSSVDKKSTKILKYWFDAHYHNPFPSEEEKKALAFLCDLEVKQVSTWFGNHRGRCKRKLLDSPKPSQDIPLWVHSSK